MMSTRRLLIPIAVIALGATACSSGGGDATDGEGSTITVTGTNALAFEPETLTASAGTVTVELTAEDADEHTFVVEEVGDTEVVAAAAGETATGSVDLESGAYTFYCDIPGHRAAGMEGELTVQ